VDLQPLQQFQRFYKSNKRIVMFSRLCRNVHSILRVPDSPRGDPRLRPTAKHSLLLEKRCSLDHRARVSGFYPTYSQRTDP